MSAKKTFILVHVLIISFFGTFIYFRFIMNAKETAPKAVSLAEVVSKSSMADVLGAENMRVTNSEGKNTQVEQKSISTKGLSARPKVNLQKASVIEEKADIVTQEIITRDEKVASAPLPLSLNLDIPFYTQAPFSNWDNPWQEACEEASVLLIANAYYDHNWTREQFNDQILKLVEWEKKRFGDYKHTSVEQTAEILADYLGLKTVIVENPSYEDIMKTLNKGHLIVMTFAGKKIGNPNYKNGGPVYHAMVVKGYKEGKKVITHDVGTRKGENYVYRWSVLQNALHDWAEPIESGEKRMIEVLPPSL